MPSETATFMTRREVENQLQQAVDNRGIQERRLNRAWLDFTDAQTEYEKAKLALSDSKSAIEIWEQRLRSMKP